MSFGKLFARRSAVCLFIVNLLFLSCCLRLYSVATADYASVQEKQSSMRIPITRLRGTVYDCKMLPITNQRTKIIAAVSPTPYAAATIGDELKDSEKKNKVLAELSKGRPVICELKRKIEGDGIHCIEIPVSHIREQPAEHTVGYLNSAGHGMTGIEKAFDDILYSKDTLDAVFKTDGAGRILQGEEIVIEGELSNIGNSVITTLDLNIQAAAEKAALEIEKGAIAVCKADTGEIRALVSKPSFDSTDIFNAMNRKNSPLLNRNFLAYNVGSVFKPCVAAAGIESGFKNFSTVCKGSTEIEERNFHCHSLRGHGTVDLQTAIAESCNVFFYEFALATGRDAIYNRASMFNFGMPINLGGGMMTDSGSVPSLQELSNEAALANMSIGQGKVTLTPVSMLTLYSAIAGDGTYRLPTLIKETVKNGKREKLKSAAITKAMEQETADILKKALLEVVENGTGKAAKPQLCTAAGKTATAQTGKFSESGKEITNGWFCGFFPFENPKYVAVIMKENAIGSDVTPVFAELADSITEISKYCD